MYENTLRICKYFTSYPEVSKVNWHRFLAYCSRETKLFGKILRVKCLPFGSIIVLLSLYFVIVFEKWRVHV